MNVHVTRLSFILSGLNHYDTSCQPEESVNSDEYKKRSYRETKENTGRDWY